MVEVGGNPVHGCAYLPFRHIPVFEQVLTKMTPAAADIALLKKRNIHKQHFHLTPHYAES